MNVYISSIIWRKKSFSMKWHVARMLHVYCMYFMYSDSDSVTGTRAGVTHWLAAAAAGRAAAA